MARSGVDVNVFVLAKSSRNCPSAEECGRTPSWNSTIKREHSETTVSMAQPVVFPGCGGPRKQNRNR